MAVDVEQWSPTAHVPWDLSCLLIRASCSLDIVAPDRIAGLAMKAVPEEVENKIRAALRANRTEIVRSKNPILHLVRSGDAIGVGQLQRVLLDAEETRDPQHGGMLEMADPGDYSEQDLRSLPLIAHRRLARSYRPAPTTC